MAIIATKIILDIHDNVEMLALNGKLCFFHSQGIIPLPHTLVNLPATRAATDRLFGDADKDADEDDDGAAITLLHT